MRDNYSLLSLRLGIKGRQSGRDQISVDEDLTRGCGT